MLPVRRRIDNTFSRRHDPRHLPLPEEREVHVESAAVALLRVEVAGRDPGANGGAPVKLGVVPPGRIPHELVNVGRAHDAPVTLGGDQGVMFRGGHGGALLSFLCTTLERCGECPGRVCDSTKPCV